IACPIPSSAWIGCRIVSTNGFTASSYKPEPNASALLRNEVDWVLGCGPSTARSAPYLLRSRRSRLKEKMRFVRHAESSCPPHERNTRCNQPSMVSRHLHETRELDPGILERGPSVNRADPIGRAQHVPQPPSPSREYFDHEQTITVAWKHRVVLMHPRVLPKQQWHMSGGFLRLSYREQA